MTDSLDLVDFKKILENINKTIQDKSGYLSELDSVIGDGDHGTTIARGFKKTVKEIEKESPLNISELLKIVGFTLISSMG